MQYLSEMPVIRWELVAIVPENETYEHDLVDFVPPEKRYKPEEIERILSHPYFYKVDGGVYDIGPTCDRQIGHIVYDHTPWPDENLEENGYTGIYKMIFIDGCE